MTYLVPYLSIPRNLAVDWIMQALQESTDRYTMFGNLERRGDGVYAEILTKPTKRAYSQKAGSVEIEVWTNAEGLSSIVVVHGKDWHEKLTTQAFERLRERAEDEDAQVSAHHRTPDLHTRLIVCEYLEEVAKELESWVEHKEEARFARLGGFGYMLASADKTYTWSSSFTHTRLTDNPSNPRLDRYELCQQGREARDGRYVRTYEDVEVTAAVYRRDEHSPATLLHIWVAGKAGRGIAEALARFVEQRWEVSTGDGGGTAGESSPVPEEEIADEVREKLRIPNDPVRLRCWIRIADVMEEQIRDYIQDRLDGEELGRPRHEDYVSGIQYLTNYTTYSKSLLRRIRRARKLGYI